jgi:hypothetical protein
MVEYSVMEDLVEVRAVGTTTPEQWLDAQEAITEMLGEREVDAILDFTRHENVIPVEAVEKLSARIRVQRTKTRWAFVVSRPVSVGMVNMIWRPLASAKIEARTFETEEAARTWLAEPRDV